MHKRLYLLRINREKYNDRPPSALPRRLLVLITDLVRGGPPPLPALGGLLRGGRATDRGHLAGRDRRRRGGGDDCCAARGRKRRLPGGQRDEDVAHLEQVDFESVAVESAVRVTGGPALPVHEEGVLQCCFELHLQRDAYLSVVGERSHMVKKVV